MSSGRAPKILRVTGQEEVVGLPRVRPDWIQFDGFSIIHFMF